MRARLSRWVRRLSGPVLGLALVAGPASAGMRHIDVELDLQFTNLAQAKASDTTTSAIDMPALPLDTLAVPNLTFPSATLTLDGVIPVTDPLVSCGGVMEIRLTSIRPRPGVQGGTFGNLQAAISSPANAISPATLPISGQWRLCLLFAGCGSSVLTFPLGQTTSSGFVGAGVGGILTMVGGFGGTVKISVEGAPWTVNTVTAFNRTAGGALDLVTQMGFAHGPASATSTVGEVDGVLQLVTASQVTTEGIPGNADLSGVFNRLTVKLPEPSSAALLLGGAIACFALGLSKRRKP